MGKIAIIINKAMLRGKARELEGRTQELHALNTRLATLIGSIQGSWEGQASEAWLNTMQAYLQQAQGMIEVLQEFKGYANQAADEFEEEDNEAASIIFNAF